MAEGAPEWSSVVGDDELFELLFGRGTAPTATADALRWAAPDDSEEAAEGGGQHPLL